MFCVISTLISVVLTDSVMGVSLKVPEGWSVSQESMGPGLILTSGEIKVEIDYQRVSGRGYTTIDVMRLNQEDVREFLRGTEYQKTGETQELNLPGGFAVKTRAARKRAGQKTVAFILTGAWGFGERGTVEKLLRIRITRQNSLKFTRDQEDRINQLLDGLGFF